MGEVPVDRFCQPRLKGLVGNKPQISLDLRRIDGVAPIVAGAIRDELNQGMATRAPRLRRVREPRRKPRVMCEALIHHAAQQPDDIEVGPLVVTADVVDLTGRAGLKNTRNTPGMVLNVKPVADVTAITVHGDHATIEDPR